MKGHRTVYGGAMLSLAIVLAFGVVKASANDRVRTVVVDCTSGRTIARALERGDEDKPIVVIVQGICNENVVIDRDDVMLQGSSSGDGITALDPTKDTILVQGARRVGIENLTVSGGSNGITFFQGSSGIVDSCAVQNSGGNGIRIEGASATVINSAISNNKVNGIMLENGGNGRIGITDSNQYARNTISTNGSSGIHLQHGANAYIGGNTITGNGWDSTTQIEQSGIAIYDATAVVIGGNLINNNQRAGIVARASNLRIGNPSFYLDSANTISGNGAATLDGGIFAFVGTALDIRYATITGNAPGGVVAVQSSVRIRDSHINNNAGQGIQAFLGTSLELQRTEVSGNTSFGVLLTTRSVGRMRVSSINNNALDGIRLVMGSGLFLDTSQNQGPSTVQGNGGYGLNCTDQESSYSSTFSGGGNTPADVSPNCSGF